MNCLLAVLLFLLHHEIRNSLNQTSQVPGNIEFVDDNNYPVKVDGEASYYTFDTTSFAKKMFVFVVSGSKTAFFKKGGKIYIVDHLKRQFKQNGYIDHFDGSGYQITLDVGRDKKISKGGTRYTGVLKFAQKDKVVTITVQGINEESKLNLSR
ncbi:hypothetical protein [Dyadobacter sp. CY347]|uniref:hypothetical protein n=1 Tax=Dyadobacter sp. CY347 TaxID=2909336 RepID=UPI001F2FE008|nr:hypothetical protein [Dyadobacter sp. CY347]MCF2491449.1 hypothetical protein [Dyadobacter sp. CY347]